MDRAKLMPAAAFRSFLRFFSWLISRCQSLFRKKEPQEMPDKMRRGRLKILVQARNKIELEYLFHMYENDTPFRRKDVIWCLAELSEYFDQYSMLHALLFEHLANFAALSKNEAERIYFSHFNVWDPRELQALEHILTINTRKAIQKIDRRIKAPRS